MSSSLDFDARMTAGSAMSYDSVFNESYQRDLTFETMLAEYNEDVNRIVRVDARPVVRNRFVSRGSLVVNGAVMFTVLYISDSSRQMRSYTFSGEFEDSCDLRGAQADNANCRVRADVRQVNCRLLNARKLSLKVQLGITAEVLKPTRVCEDAHLPEDAALERLVGKQTMCSRLCSEEKEVKAREEMILPADKPIIGEVVYADLSLCVTDVKALYDKALVKLDATLRVLYVPQNTKGEYISVVHTFPQSQVVDVDGMDDDYKCSADAIPATVKLGVDQDSYGDSRIFTAEIGYNLNVDGYRNMERECLLDAFSPQYDCTVQYQRRSGRLLSDIITTNLRLEDSMVIEDNPPEKVVDIVGAATVHSLSLSGNLALLSGSADMSVVVQSADGYLENLDCTVDFKRDIDIGAGGKNNSALAKATIKDAEAVMNGGKLTITLEIVTELMVFENVTHQMVSGMEINRDRPVIAQQGAQFLIYYPTRGESVWNIAKQYHVSQSRIMQANNMDSPALSDRRMLIIPCK